VAAAASVAIDATSSGVLSGARGRRAATVADHVVPHRGHWTAFVTGNLQSLCELCRKSTKAQSEQRSYACGVGLDGLPIDPNHPFNLVS
jgi:hypothetical protein